MITPIAGLRLSLIHIFPTLHTLHRKEKTSLTYEEKKAWLWRYRSAKRFELLRLDELATLEAGLLYTSRCV